MKQSWTIGQNEVTTERVGDYLVYKSVPPKTLADDPPTSERARAHGLRRINRKHFAEPQDRIAEDLK